MAARIQKYPFPIHVNIANFVTIKLAEDNFLLWQAQFHRFLRSQDLFGFINGETPPPAQMMQIEIEGSETEVVNPDHTDWMKTDQLISSWISGAVSENILSLIIGLETSYEVWQTLLNRFTQKSVAKEFELRGKLQACQKRDRSLNVYLREFKSICDQLNAIGKPVDEITKMFGVLEGLGSEYESFRTTMYCLKPQPDYDEVISQLERFETRLQTYSVNQYNPNLAYYGQRKSAGIVQNSNFRNQRGNSRGGYGYGRGRAVNIRNHGNDYVETGRNQHYRMNNPNLNQEDQVNKLSHNWSNYGQGFRPYVNSSQKYQATKSYPPQSVASGQNMQNVKIASNSPLECQICKRPGHTALRCWYRFDNSYQADEIPTALAAMHIEDSHGTEWYPDTGA